VPLAHMDGQGCLSEIESVLKGQGFVVPAWVSVSMLRIRLSQNSVRIR